MIYEFIKYKTQDFFKSLIFKLSSEKRQHYLLLKNASIFLGYQNLASKIDDDGDIVSALSVSAESYKYLDNFIMYCEIKGIDPAKYLKLFTK
jgi:hypothetical protein